MLATLGIVPAPQGRDRAPAARARFRSLNHLPGDTINPQRPIAADANTLILLPLSGTQPTWRDLLLARPGRE
jgi:hypothetical protein